MNNFLKRQFGVSITMAITKKTKKQKNKSHTHAHVRTYVRTQKRKVCTLFYRYNCSVKQVKNYHTHLVAEKTHSVERVVGATPVTHQTHLFMIENTIETKEMSESASSSPTIKYARD